MASIESLIYTKLSGLSGISDILSDRIYPRIPQIDEATPFIVYSKISKVAVDKFQQSSNLRAIRIQIDIYADDYDDALEVRDIVVPGLERWSDAGSDPVVSDTFLENEIDLYEDKTEQVHIALDFILHYYGT